MVNKFETPEASQASISRSSALSLGGLFLDGPMIAYDAPPYVCILIYTVYKCTGVHTYTHACMHACMHAYIHIDFLHTYISILIYGSIQIHIQTCYMCVCAYLSSSTARVLQGLQTLLQKTIAGNAAIVRMTMVEEISAILTGHAMVKGSFGGNFT